MAVLPTSTRFANFNNTTVYFLPAVASTTMAPAQAEITAGTNLTGEIAEISGFTVTGGTIDTPDLKSEFVSKVPGRTSAADSSLTFYADLNGTDVRTILPYKTIGYIMFADSGTAVGKKVDVWPVQVNSVGKTRSVGDEVERIVIGFAITRVPGMDVATLA
jgi:hypothetical protein